MLCGVTKAARASPAFESREPFASADNNSACEGVRSRGARASSVALRSALWTCLNSQATGLSPAGLLVLDTVSSYQVALYQGG